MKNFASLAVPLFLVQNMSPAKFRWDNLQQRSFKDIKEAFRKAVALSQPDFTQRFYIDVDCSNIAAGAVLYQSGRPPICFASRKLSATERRYSTTDREFLALNWAVKRFRPYVYGTEFTVFCDHKPLLTLVKSKAHNGRQGRWQMDLEEYRFDLVYRPGRDNVVADALSRSVHDSSLDPDAEPFLPRQQIGAIAVNRPDWRSRQLADNHWATVIGLVERGRAAKGYSLGELGTLRYYGRLVVPNAHIDELIHRYHSSGHFSVNNSRNALLAAGYWFPRMRKLLEQGIRNCQRCAAKSYGHFSPPHRSLPKAPEVLPFQFVSVDLVTLPKTRNGYMYLMTMIDHATRFLEAVPLTNERADTCASAFLSQWVYRYGPPAVLHSDRGAQFTSNIFQQLLQRLGIKKSFSSAFHPEGNSIVERVHRTLKDRLRTANGDWLQALPEAVFNVNRMASSPNDGPSAFEAVFRRKPLLPADWPSLPHFRESRQHYADIGPPLGSWVALRTENSGTLGPTHTGRYRVTARPSSHTAVLDDSRTVNIRKLRSI